MIPMRECPDCGVTMKPGFFLDKGHSNSNTILKWNPGEPEYMKFFGWSMDTPRTAHKSELMDVVALRCPKCGLLRSYAVKVEG